SLLLLLLLVPTVISNVVSRRSYADHDEQSSIFQANAPLDSRSFYQLTSKYDFSPNKVNANPPLFEFDWIDAMNIFTDERKWGGKAENTKKEEEDESWEDVFG
ncbi:hypothetical protein PFISCL1PPCAC_25326, partial [Pristionchus fissidentatus]